MIAEPLEQDEKAGPPTFELGKDGAPKPPNRIAKAAAALVRAVTRPRSRIRRVQSRQDALAVRPRLPGNRETDIALTKDPNHLESLMLRADIFSRAGLDGPALESLDRAESILAAATDRTYAYTRDEIIAARAAAQSRLGRSEDALKTYKAASVPALHSYQMALLARGWDELKKRARSSSKSRLPARSPPSRAAKARLAQDPYRKSPDRRSPRAPRRDR